MESPEEKKERLSKDKEAKNAKRNVLNEKKKRKRSTPIIKNNTKKRIKKSTPSKRKKISTTKQKKVQKNWLSNDILCNTELPCNSEIVENFEQDPHAAVLVYHIQSGLLNEFEAPKDEMKDLFQGDSNKEKEDSILLNAIEKFNNTIGQDEEYVGCAGCGIICRSSLCNKLKLGNSTIDHLVLNEEFSEQWKKKEPVYQSAHNVTKYSNGSLYATSYKLIDQTDFSGYFCKKCQIPESSLTNHTRFIDFDYGVSYVSTCNNIICSYSCHNWISDLK